MKVYSNYLRLKIGGGGENRKKDLNTKKKKNGWSRLGIFNTGKQYLIIFDIYLYSYSLYASTTKIAISIFEFVLLNFISELIILTKKKKKDNTVLCSVT